jgi:hypothetical protein
MEFSRDCEMMRGGYFDNYYIQLAYNVQKAKGTAPIIVQDARTPIDTSGNFSQWDKVAVTYTDAKGDTADRDAIGFGQTPYINTSGRNDIVAAKVASDTRNLYFYVETAEDITDRDVNSSWMQIYLNIDRETSGWYGYDYIINRQTADDDTTTVAKYSGNDGSFTFDTVGEVDYRVEGNRMMIAVPLEMLNIDGYQEINVEFKIADSDTVYDEMEDFYCDGDAAPLGRLNYIYQNYIPGVSNINYNEDTTPSITTDTPDSDVPESTADSNKPAEKGCSSLVGEGGICLILAAALLCLRKKDHGKELS